MGEFVARGQAAALASISAVLGGTGIEDTVLWIFSLIFLSSSYYYYYESSRRGDSTNVGLLESFFSFVFGDGDPNHDFNSRRMQTIAEYIRSKDGVVVAEELAPFMDPQLPPLPMAELRQRNTPETRLALIKARQARERGVVDESWVLPAVLQFGGMPQVTENGNIYYRFDTLRKSMSASSSASSSTGTSPSSMTDKSEDDKKNNQLLWMEESIIPFSLVPHLRRTF